MIKNAKFSGYYFYMNTSLQGDFQICLSVPLKVALLQTFADRGQSYIQTPAKHLRWSHFAHIANNLKPLTIFAFGGLCRGCSTKRTSNCSCCRAFNNNCCGTTDTMLKNRTCVNVFLIECYEYAVLRKDLFIASFVERFETITLKRAY